MSHFLIQDSFILSGNATQCNRLHQKIQRQGQQRVILVITTVACHQQEQKYDQQIPGIKISGKQSPQETGYTLVGFWLRFAWGMMVG
jgi:hypothetical protein